MIKKMIKIRPLLTIAIVPISTPKTRFLGSKDRSGDHFGDYYGDQFYAQRFVSGD